jgi:hypothetical protein
MVTDPVALHFKSYGCGLFPLRIRSPVPMRNAEIPELTAESEEGFVDLCLEIHNLVPDEDGIQRFEAKALHKGREVAFAVALGTTGSPLEGTILLR